MYDQGTVNSSEDSDYFHWQLHCEQTSYNLIINWSIFKHSTPWHDINPKTIFSFVIKLHQRNYLEMVFQVDEEWEFNSL